MSTHTRPASVRERLDRLGACDEGSGRRVQLMSDHINQAPTAALAFWRGVLAGMAAPMLFFLPQPPLEQRLDRSTLDQSWRSVGSHLRASIRRESQGANDRAA